LQPLKSFDPAGSERYDQPDVVERWLEDSRNWHVDAPTAVIQHYPRPLLEIGIPNGSSRVHVDIAVRIVVSPQSNVKNTDKLLFIDGALLAKS
jgi:hypothetical protein